MEWISCKDELPEDGQPVIVTTLVDEKENAWWFSCCVYNKKYGFPYASIPPGLEITHWGPLSPP